MRRVLQHVDETMFGPSSKHTWSVNRLYVERANHNY